MKYLLLIVTSLVLAACVTPLRTAAAEFQVAYSRAMDDGQIDPKEAAELAAKAQAVAGAPGVDWNTVGVAAGTILIAMFPLLRYLPNSAIVGKQEALALDKAAGIT